MRNILIRLLGGVTKTEHLDKIENINRNIELSYIDRYKLDYA